MEMEETTPVSIDTLFLVQEELDKSDTTKGLLSFLFRDHSLGCLNLSNKQIHHLKKEDFQDPRLSLILRLDISDNPIDVIETGVFDMLENLLELDMFGIPMKRLPIGIFDNLQKKLTKLIMSTELCQLYHHNNGGSISEETLGLINTPVEEVKKSRNPTIRKLRIGILTKEIYSSFDLTFIVKLEFGNKNIRTISDNVFDPLINLRELYLFNNQIETLPDGVFDKLTNLSYLSLASNHIKELPVGIFDNLHALNYLSLYNNRLQKLPSHLFNHLTQLKELYISCNFIKELEASHFDRLTQLVELYLFKNQITRLPNGIFDKLEGLKFLFMEKELSELYKHENQGPISKETIELINTQSTSHNCCQQCGGSH